MNIENSLLVEDFECFHCGCTKFIQPYLEHFECIDCKQMYTIDLRSEEDDDR